MAIAVATRRAREVSRRSARQDVECLRQNLPVHLYTFLLHQAACTGFLPTLNQHGRPVPPDELTEVQRELSFLPATDRIKVLQYLIDKRMPSVKALEIQTNNGADLLAANPSDARHLGSGSLLAAAGMEDDDARDAVHEPDAEELFGVARADPDDRR